MNVASNHNKTAHIILNMSAHHLLKVEKNYTLREIDKNVQSIFSCNSVIS